MKTNKSDHGDLSREQMALVEKAEEVLSAGGQLAETLSDMILNFHRGLRRELHQAQSPCETGAGDEGKVSPTDDKSDR